MHDHFVFFFLIAGVIKYIYFAIADCVLLAVGGNHPSDIISRTVAGKIRVIYDDTGYSEVSVKINMTHTHMHVLRFAI